MVRNDKAVLDAADYIIKNVATIKTTAKHFNKSESTIKKYVNARLKNLDEDLYLEVKEVQQELMSAGRKIGAQLEEENKKKNNKARKNG